MNMRVKYLWVVAIILWVLAGCQGFEEKTPLPSVTLDGGFDNGTLSESPTSTLPLETPTPTEVIAELSPGDDTPETTLVVQPTPAPAPLRFVFPQSGPPPVSAWRPPLYDIPWAPSPYDHFYFGRPIAADEVNWPLADYRYGGVFFDNVVHTGVDIPAERGTDVLAAADGKIVWVGYGLYRGVPGDLSDPYGMAVVIQHNFGYQGKRLYTVYGHLDRIDVQAGQWVQYGDKLGVVGATGFVTGPHLHFEVRLGESDFFKTLNPELWLVPPQGWGIVVMRVMGTSGQLLYFHEVVIQNKQTGKLWRARTYAEGAVNPDPYYQENLVVSDLPAGQYLVSISYAGKLFEAEIEINPGRVTYLQFWGRDGFDFALPENGSEDYQPPG